MSDAAILALGEALRFEAQGRDYYTKCAEEAKDPVVKAVFTALAKEEDLHVARIRAIYDKVKDLKGWPSEFSIIAAQSGIVSGFEREALKAVNPDLSVSEALKKAMALEGESLSFYRARLSKATCDAEIEFYKLLVAEEAIHLDLLKKTLGS